RAGERLRRLDLNDVLIDSRVYALAPLPDGSMLVGTRQGLLHIDGSRRRLHLARDGLPGGFVLSAVADSAGAWIGTDRGLARWENGRVRPADEVALPEDYAVVALARDSDGRLWIGGRAGGVYIHDGG